MWFEYLIQPYHHLNLHFVLPHCQQVELHPGHQYNRDYLHHHQQMLLLKMLKHRLYHRFLQEHTHQMDHQLFPLHQLLLDMLDL